ncbi:MAG: hemolysin family protein [Acidobacteriaceae bacterium]
MTFVFELTIIALLCVLALAAYVDQLYSEMGKFLSREFQENIDAWTRLVEPRLRLSRENIALSAAVLTRLSLIALAMLFAVHLFTGENFGKTPTLPDVVQTVFALMLVVLIFDRLLPYMFFMRTRGLWIARITLLVQVLFYLVLPVTLLLGLLLSIAALAETQKEEEPEHSSEGVDALLEAGEEEGILEESDRELVRSAVEFGDKVVRELMTPRPEMFAVPATLTLEQFTEELNEHAFSRVPVYAGSLDQITGIAFAHDLLQIPDSEAGKRTVAQIQRPAVFVPETKKVNELLREMQREKQHMRIVIDEYGSVAGLVTIEDLLEEIVGNIADEHDTPEDEDTPVLETNGAYVVNGSFEVTRLEELFGEGSVRLPEDYEATTLGGLVTEMAGRIPLPGEVVESEGLRFEILSSTDRRVDRLRLSLLAPPEDASANGSGNGQKIADSLPGQSSR